MKNIQKQEIGHTGICLNINIFVKNKIIYMDSLGSKALYYIFPTKGIIWIIATGFFYGLFTSFVSTLPSDKDQAIILADSVQTDSLTIMSLVQDSTINTDTRPTFNYENIKNYIFDNLHYPQEAIKEAIEGKVYVSFNIEADGKTSGIKIIRPVHPLLDQEAIRLIANMPHWKPIFYKNSPQRLSYTIPVIFELKD